MARKREKTTAEPKPELAMLRKFQFFDGLFSFLSRAVSMSGFVLIARYAYLSIDSLAGVRTFADIGVDFLADVRLSVAFAWTLAAGGIGYGWSQRRLRKRTVGNMHVRLKELEAGIDRGRSSSGLTRRGDTRPGDKR